MSYLNYWKLTKTKRRGYDKRASNMFTKSEGCLFNIEINYACKFTTGVEAVKAVEEIKLKGIKSLVNGACTHRPYQFADNVTSIKKGNPFEIDLVVNTKLTEEQHTELYNKIVDIFGENVLILTAAQSYPRKLWIRAKAVYTRFLEKYKPLVIQ